MKIAAVCFLAWCILWSLIGSHIYYHASYNKGFRDGKNNIPIPWWMRANAPYVLGRQIGEKARIAGV